MSKTLTATLSGLISRLPWVGLCLLFVIAAARCWTGAVDALVYDRALIAAGEWWRLITAHVVHFSTAHLLRNTLLLLPATFWLEMRDRASAILVLSLAPAVSLTVLLAVPSIAVFAGASGIAYGMIIALAINRLLEVPEQRRWWWAVLALAVGKCLADTLWPILQGGIGAGPSGIVHSLGAIAGGMAGLTRWLLVSLRK